MPLYLLINQNWTWLDDWMNNHLWLLLECIDLLLCDGLYPIKIIYNKTITKQLQKLIYGNCLFLWFTMTKEENTHIFYSEIILIYNISKLCLTDFTPEALIQDLFGKFDINFLFSLFWCLTSWIKNECWRGEANSLQSTRYGLL